MDYNIFSREESRYQHLWPAEKQREADETKIASFQIVGIHFETYLAGLFWLILISSSRNVSVSTPTDYEVFICLSCFPLC